MKPNLACLLVMLLAAVSFGRPPASAPAVTCPGVEAIIASVPADLWPKEGAMGPAFIMQGTAIKAWSDAHVAGTKLDISALTMIPRPGGATGNHAIFMPSKANVIVEVVNVGTSTATTVTIAQVSIINNNGLYMVNIAVK